jgi:hypothetical protein
MENLRPMIHLMMVAEVYTAWVIYGIGTAFGGLVFLAKEQHKQNWIGYLAIFLFILGTALMWHYMRDGSRLGMAELIREAYKHPQIYGASP